VTDTPQLSGKDLAFQALATARAAARHTPTAKPARAKTTRMVRTGGRREPASLADIINGLNADSPLDGGVAGGSIINQWPTLCPQYDGLVQPVAYDEDRGRLDLRPSTHAYAAQLRILGGQLAKQINDKLGKPAVRTIRVLPVGNLDHRPVDDAAERPDPDVPVRTRDTASAGYQATLALALDHKPERQPTDPYTLEAMARQEAALRAGRQPEQEHREAVWAEADTNVGPAPGSVEESLARARAYARQTRVGRAPRKAFDVA